ncbi:MAG: hypothetical protein ACRD4X_01735 [Candidatus Acidiferrales bacterium]
MPLADEPAANVLVPLNRLIESLTDPDPSSRERAAISIFRRGCELAQSITQPWLLDPEVATCIIRDRTGTPELTVGIAVQPETFRRIHAAFGSPRLADVPPDQDAQEFGIDFVAAARLDVLTTAAPEGIGAIARFLQKSGEGVQQVEIGVTDVDRVTDILRVRFGLAPVYPATRTGADGARVNFFLVPVAQNRKVLIELVENSPQKQRYSVK